MGRGLSRECSRITASVFHYDIDDVLANGKRRRSRRRRDVAHMHDAFRVNDVKVVNQFTVDVQGLRTNARSTRNQIVGSEFWHKPLERPDKSRLAP